MSSSGKRCLKWETRAKWWLQAAPGLESVSCVSWVLTGVGETFPHHCFVHEDLFNVGLDGWHLRVDISWSREFKFKVILDKGIFHVPLSYGIGKMFMFSHGLTSGHLSLDPEGTWTCRGAWWGLMCPSLNVERGGHLHEAFPAMKRQVPFTCSFSLWQVHATQSNDLLLLFLCLEM